MTFGTGQATLEAMLSLRFVVVIVVLLVLSPATACGGAPAPVDDGDGDGASAAVSCGEPGDVISLPYQAAALEGCTRLRASLHIGDAASVDVLEPVARITRIDGRVTFFRNHALADLRGLERLEVVGGLFSITHDDSGGTFRSLDGLVALREVGGVELTGNAALSSLAGLAALEVVRGDVHIERNPALLQVEVDALLARIQVEGDVVVAENGP